MRKTTCFRHVVFRTLAQPFFFAVLIRALSVERRMIIGMPPCRVSDSQREGAQIKFEKMMGIKIVAIRIARCVGCGRETLDSSHFSLHALVAVNRYLGLKHIMLQLHATRAAWFDRRHAEEGDFSTCFSHVRDLAGKENATVMDVGADVEDADVQRAAWCDAAEVVIQTVAHSDPPTCIDSRVATRLVDEQHATYVEQRLSMMMEGVDRRFKVSEDALILCDLNRNARCVRQALTCGVSLRQCRDRLAFFGHSWKLDSGALIFVHPWQYRIVIVAIRDLTLHPSNIIFAKSLEYLVAEAMASCSAQGAWMKTRREIDCHRRRRQCCRCLQRQRLSHWRRKGSRQAAISPLAAPAVSSEISDVAVGSASDCGMSSDMSDGVPVLDEVMDEERECSDRCRRLWLRLLADNLELDKVRRYRWLDAYASQKK